MRQHITAEVGTFITSRYQVCAGHRVPKIIKIGWIITELFQNW